MDLDETFRHTVADVAVHVLDLAHVRLVFDVVFLQVSLHTSV